ncbi:MAG: diaminopimelate epimerase [Pseudobdellovibrio sp.]
MTLNTYQISGAGNTFSILWGERFSDHTINTVKDICKKTQTDGFIFLYWINQEKSELGWDFFNNDGSPAEMCGNATRCVAFYIRNILADQRQYLVLKTVAGWINIKILGSETFEVTMTKIEKFSHPKYFWCDTGVPHIVIETDDFENYRSQKETCRKLRFHDDFLPRGTNVTLVHLDESDINKLKAVSYERGVEDFTSACGTGAMAAAFYNLHKRGVQDTLVSMPGGLLKMNLNDLTHPTMTGPAIQIGEFIYEE